jgi:adenylate kinase family enzyme
MLNVCYQCGKYRADKIINLEGPYAVCPECGHPHPFLHLPLWVVSGASGSGKSTICSQLIGQLDQFVVLESDILWQESFNHPETNYRTYFETWLRMCKNIAQSCRPVVLFGTGFGVPDNLEKCIERRYFSKIYYMALTCSEDALTERLQTRPKWRNSHQRTFLDEQKRFNQWFLNYNKNNLQPTIHLLDTTQASFQKTSNEVKSWITSIDFT